MKKPKMPADTVGWEHLTGAIIKAELKLAGMTYRDLQAALRELGVEQTTANISAKLTQGRFSATFLLQALVAIGVDQIELPRRAEPSSPS
jgi:hypothetical protein